MKQPFRTIPAWLILLSMIGCARNERPPDTLAYYQNDGHELALHLFRASSSDRSLPAPMVLLFHGGGWQGGEPTQFHPQCRVLSASGYHCISAAYRVATRDGSTVQESVDDARTAFDFVRDQALHWGADPDRLIVGGGSAGGHLAALLATGQAGVAAPRQVAALLLFNPMLNLAPGRPDHHFVKDNWESLSPRHQLAGRLPPTLILLGDSDPEVPVATAEDFCDRAKAFGATCRLDIAKRQGHGFFNRWRSNWHFYRTLAVIERFLTEQQLGPKS